MKNIKTIVCLLVFALCSASVCSCGVLDDIDNLTYEYWEKYTAGSAEITQELSALDLNWIAGNVNIVYGEGSTLSLSETSETELTETRQLRWWLDGTTLRVQFASYGFLTSTDLKKSLTVSLPSGLELSKIYVGTVSADVKADGLLGKSLEIVTVSGKATLSGAQISDKASFNTVSGKITAEFSCALEEFNANTVSGGVDVEALSIESFKADTVSGEIYADFSEEVKAFAVHTVSGGVTLEVPEASAFTVKYNTVSGDFSSQIPTALESETYIPVSGEC